MPNHVSTILTVSGPTQDVNAFMEASKAKDAGKNTFSFEGLLPMPDEIRNVSYPVKIMTQEEIDVMWASWNQRKENKTLNGFEHERPFGLGITQENVNNFKLKYGHNNWYDWSLANWGTKWGCYDVAPEWTYENVNENFAVASIWYNTAWSPATRFYLTVSKQFPNLIFKHEFADEGGGFLGSETICNGEIKASQDFDWDNEEGVALRTKLGIYHEEDYCDEDEELLEK